MKPARLTFLCYLFDPCLAHRIRSAGLRAVKQACVTTWEEIPPFVESLHPQVDGGLKFIVKPTKVRPWSHEKNIFISVKSHLQEKHMSVLRFLSLPCRCS